MAYRLTHYLHRETGANLTQRSGSNHSGRLSKMRNHQEAIGVQDNIISHDGENPDCGHYNSFIAATFSLSMWPMWWQWQTDTSSWETTAKIALASERNLEHAMEMISSKNTHRHISHKRLSLSKTLIMFRHIYHSIHPWDHAEARGPSIIISVHPCHFAVSIWVLDMTELVQN